jgi:RimJ/RimL family protein N-acetyltransferase
MLFLLVSCIRPFPLLMKRNFMKTKTWLYRDCDIFYDLKEQTSISFEEIHSAIREQGLVSDVKFHLLNFKDLKKAATLSMESFYKPRFLVNSANIMPIEAILLNGLASSLHAFDRMDAWLANYLGFRFRGGKRLRQPNLDRSLDSLIIIASISANHSALYSQKESISSWKTSDRTHRYTFPTKQGMREMIGLVELCSQEVNGLLTSPMKLPFLPINYDKYEPYLCNLCVARSYRGLGIGKSLCILCEAIAQHILQKQSIYLHVERENVPAQRLYLQLGYEQWEFLNDNEKRRFNMVNIDYFRKYLNRS